MMATGMLIKLVKSDSSQGLESVLDDLLSSGNWLLVGPVQMTTIMDCNNSKVVYLATLRSNRAAFIP